MKPWRQPYAVTFLFMLVFTAGCNRAGDEQRFGAAIDPQATALTLAELVAKPDAYEGKNVVVEGQFAGACGDGDFYFKDKFEVIEADPPSAELLRLKKGTPIRLYGRVKVQRSGGQEAEEQGEAVTREAAGAGQVYVKIAGKGVEVIR
jgi:hypothetical protein